MQTKTISHDDIARLRGLLDCYQIAPGGEVADGLLDEAAKILKAYQAAEPAAADILAGATINDITERQHRPTGDGWIEWKGGNCPVPADTCIDIRFRDGNEDVAVNALQGLAHNAYWHNDDSPADIIAYRLHKPGSAQA